MEDVNFLLLVLERVGLGIVGLLAISAMLFIMVYIIYLTVRLFFPLISKIDEWFNKWEKSYLEK